MTQTILRPSIHTASPESLGLMFSSLGQSSPSASSNWPAANDAIFVPFTLERPAYIQRLFSINGSVVNGNIDVGVYSVDGALIKAAGSTAQAGTSAFQFFNVADFLLTPGNYYLACALSSGTGRVLRYSTVLMLQQQIGVMKMATAFPLPATATFAAPTSAYVPHIGMELVGVL